MPLKYVQGILPQFMQDKLNGEGMAKAAMRGSINAFLIKCVAMLVGFISSVLLSRSLGVNGFGMYSLAIGWVLLFAVPVQSGLVGVVVRETAKYMSSGDFSHAKGLLIFSNFVSILLSLLGVGVLLGYWIFGKGPANGLSFDVAAWSLLLLPVYCLSAVRSATLRGLGKVTAGLVPDELVRPTVQVLILALSFLVLESKLTPTNAIQIHAFAAVFAFAIGAYLLFKALPSGIGVAKASFSPAEWSKPALSFALVAGFGTILQSAVMVMLGMKAGAVDAGLFKSAQQLSALSGIFIVAVNSASAPYIASLYKAGDKKELSRLLSNGAKFMVLGTAPVVLVMLLFGKSIISLIFGHDFILAYTSLFVLLLGQLLISGLGMVGLLLNMSGHEKDTLFCCTISLLLTIISAHFVVHDFGAVGAAISVVVGQIVLNALMLWRVKVRVGVSTAVYSKLFSR